MDFLLKHVIQDGWSYVEGTGEFLKKKMKCLGKIPKGISTKFTPPYTCIFMDEMETSFLKTQQLQQFILLRYINHIFFIWTQDEGQLKYLDKFHLHLKSM